MSPPKSILLVDDEAEMRGLMAEALEGYTIFQAGDGLEGLAMMERHHPDLIVSDVSMPKMDGLQMLREIRERGNKVPVIVITGFGDAEKIRTAWHLGAFDFLGKPMNTQELLNRVNIALEMGHVYNTDRPLSLLQQSKDIALNLRIDPDLFKKMEEEAAKRSLSVDEWVVNLIQARLTPGS